MSFWFHRSRLVAVLVVGALTPLLSAGCGQTGNGNTGTGGGGGEPAGSGGAVGSAGAGGVGGAGNAAGATGTGGAVGGRSGQGGNASGTGGAAAGAGGTIGGAGSGGIAGGGGGSGGTSAGGAAGGRGGSGGVGGTGAGGRGGISGSAGTTGAAGTTGSAGTTGAAGTTGTAGGGGSTSSCTTPPPASPLIGWASVPGLNVTTTTGGGNATPQTVTTVAALSAAAAGTGAAVIYVSGVLPNGVIEVGSNKTIVGLCGAEIHGHIDLSGSSNVIIRNLTIVGYAVGDCALDPTYDSTVGCSSGYDAVTVINGAHHIWIDHCDISDGTDGNLDVTLSSDFVTISWTKFHYTSRTDPIGNDSTGAYGHRFSNLVGGADNLPADVGTLNVTWHHDWWADHAVERMPRVRYGKNHIFNNLYSSSGNSYCARAGMQAELLLENNVFTGVASPHEFNSPADQGTATITATNNTYNNTTGTRATGGGGTAFTTPPYTYTLDAASSVQAAVQSGAGPQ